MLKESIVRGQCVAEICSERPNSSFDIQDTSTESKPGLKTHSRVSIVCL